MRRDAFNETFAKIGKMLSGDMADALDRVYEAWEDRLYGISRQAFYLGYCMSFIRLPGEDRYDTGVNRMQRLLLLEYELGITAPQMGQALMLQRIGR